MRIDLLKYHYVKYVLLFSFTFFFSLVVNKPGQVVNYFPIVLVVAIALWLAISDLLQLVIEKRKALVPRDPEKRKRVLKTVIEVTRIKRFAIIFYLAMALAFLAEIHFSA
jgi:hypothetical protein